VTENENEVEKNENDEIEKKAVNSKNDLVDTLKQMMLKSKNAVNRLHFMKLKKKIFSKENFFFSRCELAKHDCSL
jgi:hypothetical protein